LTAIFGFARAGLAGGFATLGLGVAFGERGGAEWEGCACVVASALAFASACAFTRAFTCTCTFTSAFAFTFTCAFALLEVAGVGDAGPTSKAETWLFRAVAHETNS